MLNKYFAKGNDKPNINIKNFGLACALVLGMFSLILGLAAWLFDLGLPLQADIASFYVGFKPTFLGMLVGVLWGLVDGFIIGVIVAWLYDRLQNYRGKPKNLGKKK